MKVKWGVIGAGGIADKRTIPGLLLSDKAELLAVCDNNQAVLENLAKKYQVQGFTDAAGLLELEEIQAVYIASPVFCHKEQASQVAGAGKHLLLEKPVAVTVAEGEQIAAAFAQADLLAGVAFMMRFHVFHQKMRELVSGGAIGQVVSCRAQNAFWYPDMAGNWRQDKALSGGGPLMDVGVHLIDLIQYITGSKARTVQALSGTKVFSYNVEDVATVLFETANGAYCTVETSFCQPGGANRGRLEIYGTKGSLLAEQTMSQLEQGSLELVMQNESGQYVFEQVELPFGNMYTKQIEHFSQAVTGAGQLELPLDDGIQVQRVVEAAYKSAAEGIRVELD